MHPLILAASNPVEHVIDHPILTIMDGKLWILSNVTVMLILASLVTLAVLLPAAKRIATGPRKTLDDLRAQGPLANFVEVICITLRDEIFKPLLGKDTDTYMPVLWTLFWFILVCNLLGLVPLVDITATIGQVLGFRDFHGIGGTATQSIWVTGALALLAAAFWNGQGLVRDFDGYFAHLTGGAPWYMWPIIVPVEMLGLIIKPVALALRLFANMTGGHVLLAALFGFVYSLIKSLGVIGWGVGLIPLFGAVAIYLLELLVAFLQAFIFTFLTGLFLSQLVVHHGDDHGHDDAQPEAAH